MNGYDRLFSKSNYFGYRAWLEIPYLKALVRRFQLEKGSLIADVGCGQGFWSHSLSRHGFQVVGIDLNLTGLRSAIAAYGQEAGGFVVGDADNLPLKGDLDCIFTRSLSTYNSSSFRCDHRTTAKFLEKLRVGGKLMFLYNTNLGKAVDSSPTWRFHTLEDVKEHFLSYEHLQVYFVVKPLALVLGRFAFGRVATTVSSFVSKHFRIGGDLVCVVTKGMTY